MQSPVLVWMAVVIAIFFFFQAEDGIRDLTVTGVQTCALPISRPRPMLCRPCTSGHLSGVNQASNTPDETGNIGACEAPSSNCTASKPANSAAPCSRIGASGVTMQQDRKSVV